MKKLFIALAVIIGIIVIWYIVRTPAYAPTASPTVTPSESQVRTPSTSVAAAASETVDITGFAFVPPVLTVRKGGSVTWINNDSAPHQMVSDSGSVISTGTLQKGGSDTIVFAEAGTYSYHCSIHPSMRGTVIVR